MTEDASDEEIRAALAELDAAREKLLARRSALAEEAAEVSASLARDVTDEEAVEKSNQLMQLLREAKKSIADSTGIGEL